MPNEIVANLAEAAATQALDSVYQCLEKRRSFRLEAGAGAGKTYSLIKALKKLLETHGSDLIRRRQQIACITFTNVAKEEIESRIDRHPAARPDTIHSFCWSILKNFQSGLRAMLPRIRKWNEMLEKNGGLGSRRVMYDLGNIRIEDQHVSIHHDDVIELVSLMFSNSKFRHILTMQYPIMFIDEYQDTNKLFVDVLKKYFLDTDDGPLLGFFGDHWQRIYRENTCGRIEHPKLALIDKHSNFRSAGAIVACLNRMRPELMQQVSNHSLAGEVRIYHTNFWRGTRRDGSRGGHWKGDTPEDVSRAYLAIVRSDLEKRGWDFDPSKTKILMLTHNVLAAEQGYRNLMKIYSGRSERIINKEDPYIAFFCDVLEPMCKSYESKKYGDMFKVLSQDIPTITSKEKKLQWSKFMNELLVCRNTMTVGDVLNCIRASNLLYLPERIEEKERLLLMDPATAEQKEGGGLERLKQLREVSYQEIMRLNDFIEGYTPFATNHAVKGAEFENVLVVIGRGWNQYDFDQMLTLAGSDIPEEKRDMFERNRNLFYVACSRPKVRLALLFTQLVSDSAMVTLNSWFSEEAIVGLASI